MSGHPPTRSAPTRWLLLLLAPSALAVAAFTCLLPDRVTAGSDADATAEARTAYSQKAAKDYTYRFGAQSPFLPSNITTDNGQFIDPKSFPTADYCGHCHQEAHAQWRQSAHSNANRAP